MNESGVALEMSSAFCTAPFIPAEGFKVGVGNWIGLGLDRVEFGCEVGSVEVWSIHTLKFCNACSGVRVRVQGFCRVNVESGCNVLGANSELRVQG